MTSRRPYWCPKLILWELNYFLMQTLSFVPINLHSCWPREWKRSITVRPRANGRNIVGQQLPTLLDVTCCVRLHMLLHVVAPSLKPVKHFSQKLPTILLFRDRWSVAQQCWSDPFAQLFQRCWDHARPLRMDNKDLWVVFFSRCTAGLKFVGSCYIRLHTTANAHATIPNIVGETMLGVVAPVCTQHNAKATWI